MSIQSTGLGEAERGRGMRFAHRVTANIEDCVAATGLSRSALYGLMKSGAVQYRLVGRHRVIVIASLLRVLDLENGDEGDSAAA
jgi:hypothetical protein